MAEGAWLSCSSSSSRLYCCCWHLRLRTFLLCCVCSSSCFQPKLPQTSPLHAPTRYRARRRLPSDLEFPNRSGDQVVAQAVEKVGEPSGTRTQDRLIKSGSSGLGIDTNEEVSPQDSEQPP